MGQRFTNKTDDELIETLMGAISRHAANRAHQTRSVQWHRDTAGWNHPQTYVCTLGFQVKIISDLHPECAFIMLKTCTLRAFAPIAPTRNVFSCLQSLNLRDLVLLAQDLEDPGALLGVGEFLKLTDLYFPILLDESDKGNRIVFDHGTIGRGEQGCIL